MVVFVGASTVWGVVGSGFGSAESCRIWLLVPSVLKNLRGWAGGLGMECGPTTSSMHSGTDHRRGGHLCSRVWVGVVSRVCKGIPRDL